MTWPVKLGYNEAMLARIVSFVLRLWLLAAVVACVWRFVKPKTQAMRILRAALLLLGLLFVLAMVKIAGR